MTEATQSKGPEAQSAMLNLIKELRSDPKRYKALQTEVAQARTDADRAKILTKFVATQDKLSRVVNRGQNVAATTTVTVTTVIIIVPSAY